MPQFDADQQELAALIDRIFEDGVVDSNESAELRDFWRTRGLTVSKVRAVVDVFVCRVWGEVIEDGVVTAEERGRLWAVVDGLRLPKEVLPGPVQKALD